MTRFKTLATSLAFCAALIAPSFASAQQMQPLPIDPAVRVGKLDNGLTYFIRKNQEPKERADFYIAQKVGSMQEEDSQAGLAHFLEHMAFNGTKNFPDKALIHYLETIGVRFGLNLNAYTAFDETVYTLMNVPTTRQGSIDSCLLILHDWSNNITLDGKEIDQERGVIHEEWRSRRDANQRMFEALLPKALDNNKYAFRFPIGTMDVVLNFKHEELRNYYKKWYRPDLQAIIVVGDIDVDYIENKLKEMFKDVPAPVNPAERTYTEVADNDETIAAVVTDPEATSTSVMAFFKYDATPREARATAFGLIEDYMQQVVSSVIRERFADILRKPNAPFVSASGAPTDFMFVVQTKKALFFEATAREGEALPALKALTAEIERLRQFGINPSEYERAKTNILKGYENQYNERESRKNGQYANEYSKYFTQGGYIPGIETEYQLIQNIVPNIPVEAINQGLKEMIGEKNVVVALMAPEKEGLKNPTEEELKKAFLEYRKQTVEPLKEEVSDQKLMEKLPTPGKIVSEKKNEKLGVTELTLSNGARVYVKPTDFNANEVLMNAESPGGILSLKPEQRIKPDMIASFMTEGGLANFDKTQLGRVLTGRTASVSPSIGLNTEGLTGRSSVADIETMMQLTYLQMTANRKDAEAFEAAKSRLVEQLKMKEANPQASLIDSLMHALFGNNMLTAPLTSKMAEKANYDQIMKIYYDRFADASDFQFFFVGSIDMNTFKPLVERYIASLPSIKRGDKRNTKDTPDIRKGVIISKFKKDLDTPSATIIDVLTAEMPYTHKNLITMEVFSGIMSQVYTATIREAEGGAYSVGAMGQMEEFPVSKAMFQIYFPTDPSRADAMNKIAFDELEKVAKNGPDKEMFEKTVKNMEKLYTEKLRENRYWLTNIKEYFVEGRDLISSNIDVVKSITPADVQKMAAELVKQKNHITVVMSSTKDK